MAIKKVLCISFFIFFFFSSNAQRILDYKVKNSSNTIERTMILDIFRAKLYEEYKYEFVFVVNHFKVGNNYAWLMADATRKDGKSIRLGDGEDCCHVEALFKKMGNKWYIAESAAFSTDLWYEGIQDRYPKAPIGIFY